MNSHPLASTPRRPLVLVLALVAAACLLVAAPRAGAVTCNDTFTGALGSGWADGANWSAGDPPTSIQNACLESGSAVEIGPGVAAEASTVIGTLPLRIDAGGSLAVGVAAELVGANVVDGEIKGSGATVKLLSGSLAGTGTIDPRFINEAGEVEPGGAGAVGTLTFGSEYAQDEGAQLDLDLASDTSFDRIQPAANANALIFGRIAVQVLGSYSPAVGTTWNFVSGTAGVERGWTMTPSEFSARTFPGGAELTLNSALPSGGGGGEGPAGGGGLGGAPVGGGTGGESPAGGSTDPGGPAGLGGSTGPGGSTGSDGSTNPGGPSDPHGSGTPGDAGTRPGSGAAVPGACGTAPLTLTDAYLKGGRVILAGSAPRSLAGKRVRILLGAKAVARASVRRNGAFHATAPAPRARRRASALYVAAVGSLRSCGTRLKTKRGGGAG
jgi:hypothetical protein